MKPNYVTFEQAKLLKELGFNIKSKFHYPNLSAKQEICQSQDWNTFTDMSGDSKYYTAPEQHQVVEWLRVNHGVWVHVEGDCYGEAWFTRLTICSKEKWENLEFRSAVNNSRFYNFNSTPQEAYSAAFDFILPTLINN